MKRNLSAATLNRFRIEVTVIPTRVNSRYMGDTAGGEGVNPSKFGVNQTL